MPEVQNHSPVVIPERLPIRVLNTCGDAEGQEPLFREAAQDALRRLGAILEEARQPGHQLRGQPAVYKGDRIMI